ncbi:hypothetical protein RFM26_30105 [Mesorhizobium sp. VK23B]|uniref:Uncharacterized protein n=1 Tax=Mesorhizobium dulcispinae TaxID=3072316 RepID=A0ABU4XNE3_9HYPH|nr:MULTISPECIES: hypothetical protein [unclassified Mesorhizobium]MDX8469939.1 hypothetical protein [Mesorhizobium sp. VK23B]MDX8476278.1 hypothetical protein [Mesorhizobium sp. VK23A]MDX8521943.1 hypothetical protein [Mesorhizobium sp. VK23D]
MAKPINPYLVLALAIILPGAGHVAVRDVRRGLAFAFFVILFSVISYMTTTPDKSFVGRHAFGLFVWALSIPDAYRRARILAVTARTR